MRALGPFLRSAWRLAVPYFRSEEKWSARGLLFVIIAIVTLIQLRLRRAGDDY